MSSQALAILDLEIPDGLARQLRIREHRLPGWSDADLEFHPDAAALAARLRTHIEPTTLPIVRQWMNDLAALGGLVPQAGSIEFIIRGVLIACSGFPASVWNPDTLAGALRRFKFFPRPVEVHDLLKPEADKVLSVIEGLEAIAKAPRAMRAIPAREPYKIQTPLPDWVGLKRGRGDHTHPPMDRPPCPPEAA